MKVYLDFQIFDMCTKNSEIKEFIMKQRDTCDFFCSTAHLEELYRAVKNAGKNPEKALENQKKAQALRTSIEQVCHRGILNPGGHEQGIVLKDESIEECLDRIEKYDTREEIKSGAKILNEQHNQPPSFSHSYNCSNEKWKAIWDEDCTKRGIAEQNWCDNICNQMRMLYKKLCQVYGKSMARYHICEAWKSVCSICRGSYKDMKNCYGKLEYVIEQLSRVLSKVGYYREKDERRFNSGEYDITHIIYGTYCDYFVTEDNRLYNKAKAIYYYLQVPTEVLTLKEFQNLEQSR